MPQFDSLTQYGRPPVAPQNDAMAMMKNETAKRDFQSQVPIVDTPLAPEEGSITTTTATKVGAYSNLIADTFGQAKQNATQQAVGSIDDEPDKAARAMELGQAWGIAPTVVYSDMDNFERNQKATLASKIIQSNQYIADYVNSHPMAAKVSNDDYGQLDAVSQAVSKFGNDSILVRAVRGFGEGFGSAPLGGSYLQVPKTIQEAQEHPGVGALAAGVSLFGALPESTFRIGAGLVTGATRATEALYEQATGEKPEFGDRFLQVISDPGLWASVGLPDPLGAMFEHLRANAELRKQVTAIEPYIAAEKPIPPGVSPVVDQVHAAQATADSEALAEALKESVASATRERSPELFANYIRGITDGEIGISADAVRKLYGDKVPSPDDGLLGFVPNLSEKLALAEATGGDVKVPIADWLAKVEPNVAKELQDHIRARDEGMTVEEAKELPGIEVYHGSPYEFEAFDTGKIGTGEGAQTYGYGHYLAEHPDVARDYADSIRGGLAPGEFEARDALAAAGNSREGAIEDIQRDLNFHKDVPKEQRDSWKAAIALLKSDWQPKQGQFYKARILRHPDEFLDWDKKLSEQSPDIQQKLRAMGVPEDIMASNNETGDVLRSHGLIGPQGSRQLSEPGIPGIKYLDQFSREAQQLQDKIASTRVGLGSLTGEARATAEANLAEWEKLAAKPTRNYVVFNDRDIEITHRNGEALRAMRQAAGLQPKDVIGDQTTLSAKQAAPAEGVPAGGAGGVPPTGEAGGPRLDYRKPTVTPDITKKAYEKYAKLVADQRAADQEWYQKRALKEASQRQTALWKENEGKVREEVADEFKGRPDWAATEYLRNGEKKIGREYLSPEQLKAIPKEFVEKGGLNPDFLAEQSGHRTGQEFLADVARFEADRRISGLQPMAYTRRLISAETERRMTARYGELEKNILEDAKEHVLSQMEIDKLHDEALIEALEQGKDYKGAKEALAQALQTHLKMFEEMPERAISSDRFLADIGRADRRMEGGALKGDFAEALAERERKYIGGVFARRALEVEKLRDKLDKTAERFKKPKASGVEQEYTDAIRVMLSRIGRLSEFDGRHALGELQAKGYKDLQDFITKKESDYALDGITFDVPSFFNTGNTDLSVGELRDAVRSFDLLTKHGRETHQVNVGGAKVDQAKFVDDLYSRLEQKFEPVKLPATPKRGAKVSKLASTALQALTSMDTVWQRFDGRDPRGPFTRFFLMEGARAANTKNVLERKYSADLHALTRSVEKTIDLNKKITPPGAGIDPFTERPWDNFTNKNLMTAIMNMGNEYNHTRMAQTLGVTPEELFKWIERNSTPELIDHAHEISKLFERGWEEYKTVKRNIDGLAPQSIETTPFTMHGKEYPGWYFPEIEDTSRSKSTHTDAPEVGKAPTTYWPSAPAGFSKQRTGATYPVSLVGYDMIPMKLNQLLHAVAFQGFIHDAAKIARDRTFVEGIKKFYGKEYMDGINQWLHRVAGNASYNSEAMNVWSRESNRLRRNVVATYIAFNPSTVEKHGLTAFMMSAQELGDGNLIKGLGRITGTTARIGADSAFHYAQVVKSMFGGDPYLGESMWQFAKRNSEEIQRRDRNFQETFMGQREILEGKQTIGHRIAQWGAKAVAFSDMLSAVPTWVWRYDQVLEETGDHGMAVDEANLSVRRAHGTTAITSLPPIVTGNDLLSPWLTTVYGFMGNNFQRRIEIAHDINDAFKMGQKEGIKAAAKQVPKIAGSIFANVFWVGAVENWVSSQFSDDHRGNLSKMIGFGLSTIAQDIIGLRDLAYGLEHGGEVSPGMLGTPVHDAMAVVRDLKKAHPFGRQNLGKFVQDIVTMSGDFTGIGAKHIGAPVRYGIDVYNGIQRPHTAGDWYRGLATGVQKKFQIK